MVDLIGLWNTACERIGDPLLGWLLALPTDLLLLALAVLTSVLMTVIRRWTSDQTLLARIAADKRRLRELKAEARARGDRDAAARLKLLAGRHALLALGQEVRPLAWSVLPVALLATWAFLRVEFEPPRPGRPLEVSLLARPSATGGLAHLVPTDGVVAEAPVRRLEPATAWGHACARATWTITPAAGDHRLVVRTDDASWEAPLRVGALPTPAALTVFPADETTIQVGLHPRRLFGVVPGALGLAPWLVGYLLLVIPLVFVVRPLLRTR